jgi:hypothetical protein
MLEEPLLGESLDHSCHGGWGQVEEVGDLGRPSGRAAKRKAIDSLEVILDGPRQCGREWGVTHRIAKIRGA